MLLELPAAVLSQMLQDEAMLTAAVEKALRALQLSPKVAQKDEDDVSQSSDSLGEQLFELVDVYNTGHSQKITGMLLEQQRDAVLQLLSDPKLLEEHVNLALKTLKEFVTDRLGEKLFSLVEQMDSLHANDITGMLLEMDAASLQQLLSDHTKLQVAVQKAQAVKQLLAATAVKDVSTKFFLRRDEWRCTQRFSDLLFIAYSDTFYYSSASHLLFFPITPPLQLSENFFDPIRMCCESNFIAAASYYCNNFLPLACFLK
uniref:PABC domain-containing protein n=1 Tax=Poecilia mexicana TaxID=48701 RepID=A0A3B3XVF5_9TELE